MDRPLTIDDCRPDALVLCVDDRPTPQAAGLFFESWLRSHNVYRVRGVAMHPGGPGVLLEETRPRAEWQEQMDAEPGFALHRFRLVDDRALDTLKALLDWQTRRIP